MTSNDIAHAVNAYADQGLNHVGFDLAVRRGKGDGKPATGPDAHIPNGFGLLANAYNTRLDELAIDHFYLTLSVEYDINSWHTAAGEVNRSINQAVIIDPQAHDRPSEWLEDLNGRSIREQITDCLQRFFGVQSVNFGAAKEKGRGPKKHFIRQHKDGCNQIVTLALFWLGIGYERIPRFYLIYSKAKTLLS